MAYSGISNGDRGASGLFSGPRATHASNAVASGSGNRVRRKSATRVFCEPVASTHWTNSDDWMSSLRLATPSRRLASIRAEDAWLKEIDIDPPHLLAWNPS